MAFATFYDPNAESEQPVPLPNDPVEAVSGYAQLSLQPPLTRYGKGPGLIVIVPSDEFAAPSTKEKERYDPIPQYKWGEEGYVTAEIVISKTSEIDLKDYITKAISAIKAHAKYESEDDRAGVIVYEPSVVDEVIALLPEFPFLVSIVSYGDAKTLPEKPILFHLPKGVTKETKLPNKAYTYTFPSPYFVLPTFAEEYNYNEAALAHTRCLEFFKRGKNNIGAPLFDLETLWEEHTYFEFENRSVAKTMGTMVAEPYVNHVPTITGGIGRERLKEFYRDHFIFSNPPDTVTELVSRTMGVDRIVDEFLMCLTHTSVVDWLLPGVPPTGKYLRIPFMCVVCVRGDRLYHEHITWDQATCMKQAGIMPDYVPYPTPIDGKNVLVKVPSLGVQTALKLENKDSYPSNELISKTYQIKDAE